jgi:hypothetical protein
MPGDFFKVRQMSSVSETVEIDQLGDACIVNDVMNEVRADEARAAGD